MSTTTATTTLPTTTATTDDTRTTTMTTTLLPRTTTDTTSAAPGLTFGTLLRVELRKASDTRSGRWLLALIVGLSAFVLGWQLFHPADGVSFRDYGGAMAGVVAFLAPIIGLLAMTAEWTQRTALTTFTLAPRRGRVLAAKFTSSMILAMATLAVGLVLTVVTTIIGGAVHGGAGWAGTGVEIRSYVIVVATQVVMATAFGALAAQTTVAIGAFLAAPAVWAQASEPLLGKAAPWFDVFSAYGQLSSNHPFDHLGQTLTAVTLWVVLPATIGVVRSLRREIK
jgi:ABC-type transport system involved in multi-copper enzyme maturation permease subunit